MTKFEQILLEEIAQTKELLRQDESLSGFTLTITASGRMESETVVEFAVGDFYNCGGVKAGALAPAITEFLRRRGWSDRHAPLCLPNAGGAAESAEISDEIPF